MTARRIGSTLCIATAITCALLHAATFLTVVPALLILLPFFLMMGAILCARAAQGWSVSAYRRTRSSMPKGKTAGLGWILLVYAVLLFVHFYRTSGGATSVGTVQGQYVYMNKSSVIRPISEREYIMFGTQIDRIMTVWIGMMAIFCLSSLINDANSPASAG